MKSQTRLIQSLRDRWSRSRDKFYSGIVVVMIIATAVKLGTEFVRLLFDYYPTSAIDLKYFQIASRDWVLGKPVYQEFSFATYPPASYLLLWPLFGALSLSTARIVWAILYLVMLWWLSRYSHKFLSNIENQRAFGTFAFLIIFALNGTGVAIGNGQIPHAILILIIWSIALVKTKDTKKQVFSGVLFFIALAKPSITAPFFWLLLFVPGNILPALIAALLYGVITISAFYFQRPYTASQLIDVWLDRAVGLQGGYGNLHAGLQALHLKEFLLPLQLVCLVLLGIWIYKNREKDIWLLMGVTAIVARIWTYHRVYDDVLILLAIVAIFRLSQKLWSRVSYDFAIEWLGILNVLILMLPARMRFWAFPLDWIYKGGHVLFWLIDLGVLLLFVRKSNNASGNLGLEIKTS